MIRLALALVMLLCASAASAEVAPYSDWLFRLDRAGKNTRKIKAVAAADPVFARIWFYGHIFDLGIAGIGKKERARIQRNTAIFAEVLAEADPPDWVPALLVQTPPEALSADFKIMQAVLNAALNADSPTNIAIAGIGQAPSELMPHAAFYALLHRADIANPRLGGRNDAQRRLEAARGFAEALAMLEGDLEPWRALAKFRGQAAVAPPAASISESRVVEALNAIIGGKPDLGRAAIVDGRRAVTAAGAPQLRTALLGLGPALVAEQSNTAGAAGALAGFAAQVPSPWMTGLMHRRAVLAAVRADDARDAITRVDALAPLLATARPDPGDDRALIAAVQLWQRRGAEAVEAGRLSEAAALFEPAARWAAWLRRPERMAQTVPALALAAETRARSGLAGSVMLAHGRLQLRLGRSNAAVSAFDASREMFTVAEQFEDVARAELATAEAQLLTGDLVNSLELTSKALARVQDNPLVEARGLALRAQVRLRRGDLAKAFANANAGLEWLKRVDDPVKPAMRGTLHTLAAAALWADGQAEAAAERMAFGRKIHDTPTRAVHHAALLLALDRADAALNALAPHQNTPIGAIAAGCVDVRRGQAKAAAARLAPIVSGKLIDLDLRVRGRACLAAAWRAEGKTRLIAPLGALSPEEWAAVDPAEGWALHVALAGADDADAETHRAQAIEAWRVARGDGHLRTLIDAAPRAYANVGAMVQAMVDADLARKTPQWSVSLPISIWWPQAKQALSASAPRPGIDMPQDDLMTLRGGYLASMYQGRVLADPAIDEATRAGVLKRRAESWRAAQNAADMRLRRHARWTAYAAPLLPVVQSLKPAQGRTRLYVQTGDARSRAWLFSPDSSVPVFSNLPGRATLTTLRTGLDGHLASGAIFKADSPDPHRKAWKQLAQGAKTLAPQFMAAKTAPTTPVIEVIADDGPLRFFAWSALVKAPPKRSGMAPEFFATRWRFEHRLSVAALPQPAPVPPQIDLLCGGECGKHLTAIADSVRRRGGQANSPDGLMITTPRAHLHGQINANGVRVGSQQHAFKALARLNSKPFAIAVSGEVQGARRRLAASLVHGGATTLALPLGSAPVDAGMPLYWAWQNALGQKPVVELVVQRTDKGAALETRLSPIASPSADLGAALGDAKRWMAAQPVRFDTVPMHHPSQWARWLIVRP